MTRVLFAGGGTGGHLYPALALADALKLERPDVEAHFVGAKRGVEARVLPAENRPHTLLPFEPLRRSKVWQNWRLLPSMWNSMIGLRKLFKEQNPKLVVGTGGYASAPACLFAISRGVPVAIQEQNSHAGLTQRTVSRWARQVHLGFPEARKDLKPGKHTEVFELGNPIRPPAAIDKAAARATFGLSADSTVILVTGGSQGSRAINEALVQAIIAHSHARTLAPSLELLWATGPSQIEAVTAALPEGARSWVKTHGYISNMPEAMAASDIAISRAGAMATAELLAWGIPAILIPLPTAAADHQTHNAKALEAAGAGIMLREHDATPERLWSELISLVGNPEKLARMKAAALQRAQPNAAEKIAHHLAALLDA
jgi:UDP-N-acetylglucosamine--N-acetylmuramyl-(pentapeptide) pyrophosphoryl-undecaprenol N-acetylglucosamine transferase